MTAKREKEIEYFKGIKQSIDNAFNNYVANYHHSMIWMATIAIGLIAISISLDRSEDIPIIVILYLIITTYRLVMLRYSMGKVLDKNKQIDEAINKRYEGEGLDLKKLNKEMGGEK